METTITNAELIELVEKQSAQLKMQTEQIAKLQTLIDYYAEQFSLMKRHRFGSSSEKTDPDFRQISFLGDPAAVPAPEPETEEIT